MVIVSAVPQDLREIPKVAVKQFADALVVLQAEAVVVAVGRGQDDEAVQWQREVVSFQEVRRRQRREVEVGHVAQTAAERVAPQEGLCGGTGSDVVRDTCRDNSRFTFQNNNNLYSRWNLDI